MNQNQFKILNKKLDTIQKQLKDSKQQQNATNNTSLICHTIIVVIFILAICTVIVL